MIYLVEFFAELELSMVTVKCVFLLYSLSAINKTLESFLVLSVCAALVRSTMESLQHIEHLGVHLKVCQEVL